MLGLPVLPALHVASRLLNDFVSTSVVSGNPRVNRKNGNPQVDVLPIVVGEPSKHGDIHKPLIGRLGTVKRHNVAPRGKGNLTKDSRACTSLKAQGANDSSLPGAGGRVEVGPDSDFGVKVLHLLVEDEADKFRMAFTEPSAVRAEEHAYDLLDHAQRENMKGENKARRRLGVIRKP